MFLGRQLSHWPRWVAMAMALSLGAAAAPFGRVVSIGGQASDLALDEPRGVLYVANFTANRIEVVSLDKAAIQSSMNVPPQPGSVALSPDGRWLVVTHFGNSAAPHAPRNALTVINLVSSARQSFVLSSPPLGAAFGIDGLALIITSTEFLLFDPVTGGTQTLGTISDFTANTLPQPPGSFPANVVAAAMGVSGDGRWIYCLTENYRFRYDVVARRMLALGYIADPPLGPRAISVNHDGSLYTGGWGLFTRGGTILSQFPNVSGLLNVGSHAIDSARGVIYVHIPEGAGLKPTNLPPPVLRIVKANNLALRESIELPENLAGRSVLRPDGSMMYSISDSGVLFLPVGNLDRERRVTADVEDLVLRANYCDRGILTGELRIRDLSGASTAFSLSSAPGVFFSATAGRTPATIRVTLDPGLMVPDSGTTVATITLTAPESIRIPEPVRLIVSRRDSDQRGTTVNVPGKLVDLLADPIRDRFYILRQDRNQVLVFDGSTYGLIRTLDTANTPTQMAITLDRRYLLVGHDNSQIASVYDLETLEPDTPITFPGGHYPRSIAVSGKAILAATRVAGPTHKIDRVDFAVRWASEYPTLGVWENDIHINTVLVGSGNGSSILIAQADGNVMLYNASSDAFVASRRDSEKLSGAYAASNFDQFVVGNTLLNSSLVRVGTYGASTMAAGFTFTGETGFRLSAPGVMERVEGGALVHPTRMLEAPIEGNEEFAFSRPLAALASGRAVIALTVSGFTVLPWNYDAPTTPPRVTQVVSAADGQPSFAPGSLFSILGSNLSTIELSARGMPLPTVLGESCLTLNGAPIPLLLVSPERINAQLPYTLEGNATLIVRAPGGVSDSFSLNIRPAAPSVFHIPVPEIDMTIPAIYNARNGGLATGSNPVKHEDWITIFLTGLGRTTPDVEAGTPAPGEPPARAQTDPQILLGGVELPLGFAGLLPGSTGIYQINAWIPHYVPTGMSVPLEIVQAGSHASLNVRVID